jgi:hypothetical protein
MYKDNKNNTDPREWFDLAKDRNQWRALVNTAINLLV